MHHQSPDTKAPWATVPMGPALSKYLGVDPATQVQTPQDGSFAHGDRELASTSQDQEAARNSLILHLRAMHSKLPSIEDGLIADLVDELVTMAIPEAALDLARFYPTAIRDDDFRMQLAIGVAAMMVGELATSEVALIKAQSLLPNEPAPYVNLAQIFRSQDRLEEAEVWCLAGLEADLNNHRIWELLALTYRDQMGEYMPEHLLKVAEKKTSWAGVSLATSLMSTGDRYLKSSLLEKFYFQGERDPLFLIELTGAYGVAGEHEKIPPIVWQAEHMVTKGLPWQLYVHAAQAQLAMGRMEEFHRQLTKAKQDPMIPDEALAALKELEVDAESGILH